MNHQNPNHAKSVVWKDNELNSRKEIYKGSYQTDNRPSVIAQLSAMERWSRGIQYSTHHNTDSSVSHQHEIVQCVVTEGGFAPALTFNGIVIVPAGAQRADLSLVMRNLSRIPCLQIQWMENRLGCPVTFRTGAVGAGDLAETVFEANIGGAWHNLDDICDPNDIVNNPLGLQLDRDTPMRAFITLDPTLHNANPQQHQVATTLVHEITVHLTHIFPWLLALRSGVFQGAGIRSRWRTTGIQGGLASPDQEHEIFGRGDNRSYNHSVQNIHQELIHTGGDHARFQNDVRADMLDHVPNGIVPQYPI